jgi:hypothetical protein
MSHRLVVNCRKEAFDVYVGRPSKWGNPFIIGKHGDRKTVIRLYREFLFNNTQLMAEVHELHGKRLGCFCSPKSCHADVLAELANAEGLEILCKS